MNQPDAIPIERLRAWIDRAYREAGVYEESARAEGGEALSDSVLFLNGVWHALGRLNDLCNDPDCDDPFLEYD